MYFCLVCKYCQYPCMFSLRLTLHNFKQKKFIVKQHFPNIFNITFLIVAFNSCVILSQDLVTSHSELFKGFVSISLISPHWHRLLGKEPERTGTNFMLTQITFLFALGIMGSSTIYLFAYIFTFFIFNSVKFMSSYSYSSVLY